MFNKGVLGAFAVCLTLGVAGAAIVGWMYISRDRAAVTSYRLLPPEGVPFEQVVEEEAVLFKSDAVLMPVIEDLDLRSRWNLESEEEALLRLRAKLAVKPGSRSDYVKLVFKDRSQKRALEILEAINREFAVKRFEAAERGELPPMLPPEERGQ